MSIVSEFKEFAVKGNMVDMAVGIIIGGAFGKIVSSLVADVIMPPIGLIAGGVDFTSLGVALTEAKENAPAVMLKYGNFVQTCFDFFIVAVAIFVMVKCINSLRKEEEEPEAAPEPSVEEKLLTEIRDALVKK